MSKTTVMRITEHAPGWKVGAELITFSEGAGDLAGTTGLRWFALHDERKIFSGFPTRDEVTAAVDERIRYLEPVRLDFADGNHYNAVPRGTAATVLGLDAFGFLVAEDPDLPGYRYPLTPCHFASGKGSMAGGYPVVVCRACYDEVDDYFGGSAEVHPGRETVKVEETKP